MPALSTLNAGRTVGFAASFLLFSTILFFVTSKLGLHALSYAPFIVGFGAFYAAIRILKRVRFHGSQNVC